MKKFLFILFLTVSAASYSQADSLLKKQSILLHQKLVSNDKALGNYLDENLTYGHSNGWLQTKAEVIDDLNSGKIKYTEIKEDSMMEASDKDLGYVRFIGNFSAVMDGKQSSFRLKVLEIWRKKKGTWKLYARQAIRA